MAKRRIYDHRIKLAIILSGNPKLFPHLNIPPPTAKSWMRRGIGDVVTDESFKMSQHDLVIKIELLKAEVKKNKSLLEVTSLAHGAAGNTIQYKRLGADVKEKILLLINQAKETVSISLILKSIQLSKQRYQLWTKKQKKCELKDYSSCPKLTPTRLLPKELGVIKKFVEATEYLHYSLTSLWLLARKQEQIFVSLSTWFRYISKYELRRPARKKYYEKPKYGLRASEPNQYLHFDVSVLKYRNIKAYLQCVRDNFSRYILAYSVSDRIGGVKTKTLLIEAIKKAQEFGYFNKPTVISDKGKENVNKEVKSLKGEFYFEHLIAQLDIYYSNAMMESFFHQFKNRYLYYQEIKTPDDFKQCIDFYVLEHCEKIPFLALNGATPVEAYRDKNSIVLNKELLLQKFQDSRKTRIKYNQSLICNAC